MVSNNCSVCHREMPKGVDYTLGTCPKKHLSIAHTSCFKAIKPACPTCHKPLSELTAKQIILEKQRQDHDACGPASAALIIAAFVFVLFSALVIGAAHRIN